MMLVRSIARLLLVLFDGVASLFPQRFRQGVHNVLRVRYFQRPFDPVINFYAKAAERQFTADGHGTMGMLRMCAHILDKGLHDLNWEPGHSVAIYEQTRKLLVVCSDSKDSTYSWAKSVVAEYEKRREQVGEPLSPWGADSVSSPITAGDFLDLAEGRVSVRCFKEESVLPEQVVRLVEAGLAAPSSCNRQSLQVYACVEPDRAKNIASLFHGFTCFSSFVPCVLVMCADVRAYHMPVELFVPTYDTGLAVSNMALMAHAMGLSMTQLIWSGRNKMDREKRLRVLLDIPDYQDIVVGAVCGFPLRGANRPTRKSVKNTVRFI